MLQSDWFRSLIMAAMIVGLGLVAIGVFQYFDAANRLSANLAQQYSEQGDQPSELHGEQAWALVGANKERTDLLVQRNTGLILAGGGLVVIALGWLAYDFARARARRAVRPADSASNSGTLPS